MTRSSSAPAPRGCRRREFCMMLGSACSCSRHAIGSARVHTINGPASTLPVELGAEFVHGRPTETWDIINAAHLAAYDVPLEQWHLDHDGSLRKQDDFWDRVEKVLEGLDKIHRAQD